MIWKIFGGALLLAWLITVVLAFCPLRAWQRRQQEKLLLMEEDGES